VIFIFFFFSKFFFLNTLYLDSSGSRSLVSLTDHLWSAAADECLEGSGF